MALELFAGPIPGENYTSDIKNYPWHRPPEFDDLDKAIEYASEKITSRDTSISMMTLAKNGVPLSVITQMFIMGGVMRGKWTIDYGLLMAGPLTHILSLMAKAGSISYELGIEDEYTGPTDAFFKGMKELDDEEIVATETIGDIITPSVDEPDLGIEEDVMVDDTGGFAPPLVPQAPTTSMAPPSVVPDQQGMMTAIAPPQEGIM